MKIFKILIYIIAAFITLNGITFSQENIANIFKEHNVRGNFLAYEYKENKFTVFYDARCKKSFQPASTFKIVSTLIALETGIVRDSNYIFKWDSTKYEDPNWNKDMNIAEAIRTSCEPCFQNLAREIGPDRMEFFIEKFNYGENKFDSTLGDKIDKFWLNGDLMVSSYEQIYFLNNLYLNNISAKKKHIDILKSMMLIEENPQYKLFGKTGTFSANKKPFGWFIGWIETKNTIHFFTINLDLRINEKIPLLPERKKLVLDIFKYMGVIQ